MITLFEDSKSLPEYQEVDYGVWFFEIFGKFWVTEDLPAVATAPLAIALVDEFQLKILQFLVTILLINIVGIYFAWKIYGTRISERLITPSTGSAKIFEELRSGAKELKLPTEHSPRI